MRHDVQLHGWGRTAGCCAAYTVTRCNPDQEAEADYHPVRARSQRRITETQSRPSFYMISKMTKSEKTRYTRKVSHCGTLMTRT